MVLRAAMTVRLASWLGLVSTMQCIPGAVVGVALVNMDLVVLFVCIIIRFGFLRIKYKQAYCIGTICMSTNCMPRITLLIKHLFRCSRGLNGAG